MTECLSTVLPCLKKSPQKLVILGMEKAGKTQVLLHLKFGNVPYCKVTPVPTVGFNMENVTIENRR